MKRILVTSHCQTGGVAAALKDLFPKYTIEASPLPALTDEIEEGFVNKVKSFDCWVSSGLFHLPKKYNIWQTNPNFQLVKVPHVTFPAFHPDLCYVKRISTGEWINPHYNSAIALWCFMHRIVIKDAATAFCSSVYNDLGYFDLWKPSELRLRQAFIEHDLEQEFNKFFLTIKRNGCFMHSINHPKICVLIELAKIVAMKIGPLRTISDHDIMVADSLTDIIWPVYPEIADYYAINSNGYVFKWFGGANAVIQSDITEYLEFVYEGYASQKSDPADMGRVLGLGGSISVDNATYDRVLNHKFGVKN